MVPADEKPRLDEYALNQGAKMAWEIIHMPNMSVERAYLFGDKAKKDEFLRGLWPEAKII